jgi:hypothetical protein
MAQRLSAEQRRALAILADAGPRGGTHQLMMAHGFTFDPWQALSAPVLRPRHCGGGGPVGA